MKSLFLFIAIFLCGFTRDNNIETGKKEILLSQKAQTNHNLNNSLTGPYADSIARFERNIYFEIDEIYTGKTYIDKNNANFFYRVLVVPQEENIMLIAEKISVGDEGGNLKLIKLSRITDNGSVLPKFGLFAATSIRFTNSVNIEGTFNKKKMVINLDKLKAYHPIF